MKLINTSRATINKRYKRFLADITTSENEEKTIYVPNTGSMKTCWENGWPIIMSFKDDPKRKYKHTLEMLHNGDTWIGINTSITNKLVAEALELNLIPELSYKDKFKAEVKIGSSRIDFLLDSDHYLEVKNVSLKVDDHCAFPDSVSTRGQKHLRELMDIVSKGMKASLLFVVQREDVSYFNANNDIDPEYSKLLYQANESGVQILAYQCSLSSDEVIINKKLEVRFP